MRKFNVELITRKKNVEIKPKLIYKKILIDQNFV